MIITSDSLTLKVIVKHVAGSRSYGTEVNDSDVDYRGIFLAPKKYHTPFFNIKEVVDSTEEDTKYYELGHFMNLCLKCNPNIMESLWVDEKHIVHRTAVYDKLRASRDRFLSSRVAYTTGGYAFSQLRKMKSQATTDDMTPKTAKSAMHLIRLLLMGLFALEEGRVFVEFDDHYTEQLRGIRSGDWSVKDIISYAESLQRGIDRAYASTSLRKYPPLDFAANLFLELQEESF